MAIVIKDGIQHRRGTAEALKKNNPLLKRGEIITEVDTHQAKVGDGEKRWNSLPYIGGSIDADAIRSIVQDYLTELIETTSVDGGEINASVSDGAENLNSAVDDEL